MGINVDFNGCRCLFAFESDLLAIVVPLKKAMRWDKSVEDDGKEMIWYISVD